MSVWILLWLVLSAIILGATAWSTYILYRQKQAWQALATRHKMTFTRGRLMGSPMLDGFIENYRVSFFTAERQSTDIRARRYVTVVEIVFPEGIINGVAAGTPEMVTFMETLSSLSPMAITHEKWDPSFRLYARNRDAVRQYLTPSRLEHLCQLLATRNADVIIIFDETQGVVRLETSDPILDPMKAEKVILRLIRHAQGLSITRQEREEIMQRSLKDEELPPETKPSIGVTAETAAQSVAIEEEPAAIPADQNSASV